MFKMFHFPFYDTIRKGFLFRKDGLLMGEIEF